MHSYFISDYDTNTFKEMTVQEFLNKIVMFDREQYQLSKEMIDAHVEYCENHQTCNDMIELFDMLTSVKEIVSVIYQDSECDIYVVIK